MIVDFTPLNKGVEAREDETVLDAARRVGAPIGNACGGVGVCARCVIRVVSGGENLGEASSTERRVAERFGLAEDQRLACQTVVHGDCTVTADYWR